VKLADNIKETISLVEDFSSNLVKIIISKQRKDEYMMKSVQKFLKRENSAQTSVQISALVNNCITKTRHTSRKIAAQPANIAKRKSTSRSKRILKGGRPLKNAKIRSKPRVRNFAKNVTLNIRQMAKAMVVATDFFVNMTFYVRT